MSAATPTAADLDQAAIDLLLAVVRARPATPDELRAVAGHRPDALLGQLVAAGLVRVDGAEVAPVEVIHGSDRVWESWSRVANQRTPVRPGNCNNDLRIIREQVLTRLDDVRADFEARGYGMRVLTTMDEVSRPENADVAPALLSIGVEVRVAPTVPSWFYVDDGIVAAIPLQWGAGGPVNGMLAIHNPSIIGMLSQYFERLWALARPLPLAHHGWESVLELLAQGRTDEQIADTLGLGVRTVRRRIAEAMDDLGALGRFELGMAWQRHLDGE